jgi:hypothetical protein
MNTMSMNTAENIMKSNRSSKARLKAAKEQCKYYLDESDVEAAKMNQGWTTYEIFEFADGSKIRHNCNGVFPENPA